MLRHFDVFIDNDIHLREKSSIYSHVSLDNLAILCMHWCLHLTPLSHQLIKGGGAFVINRVQIKM